MQICSQQYSQVNKWNLKKTLKWKKKKIFWWLCVKFFQVGLYLRVWLNQRIARKRYGEASSQFVFLTYDADNT